MCGCCRCLCRFIWLNHVCVLSFVAAKSSHLVAFPSEEQSKTAVTPTAAQSNKRQGIKKLTSGTLGTQQSHQPALDHGLSKSGTIGTQQSLAPLGLSRAIPRIEFTTKCARGASGRSGRWPSSYPSDHRRYHAEAQVTLAF